MEGNNGWRCTCQPELNWTELNWTELNWTELMAGSSPEYYATQRDSEIPTFLSTWPAVHLQPDLVMNTHR
uniref:Unclassified n=1 Tax=Fusarium clavum TaxID=2594811 RepID=W1I9P3_9HYPO|nr:unclassified [Fusarium clavum]CEF82652.1 unclassified [Fusarium clavum]